ncbi:MAG TPA: M1 family aminopeptidase [Terriglobia bacterium]|nr:M1 family aminopeptidase [Terriglobia bacterium]
MKKHEDSAVRSRRTGHRLGFLLLAAMFTAVFSAPGLHAQTNLDPYHVTNYVIDAELFPSTHLLKAKVRIAFTPTADLRSLTLELHSNLRVSDAVDATGRSLRFEQQGGQRLAVDMLNSIPAGTASSITVSYEGSLATADGSPIENLKVAYVAPEGSYLLYAGRWFPVRPDGLDRFSATLHVTVPSDEVVIASGTPSSPVRQPGTVTYGFRFDQPSFPGSVVAGPLQDAGNPNGYRVVPAVASGADITLYLKAGHEGYAASYGEEAGKIIGFFSDKFGPLPSAHLAIVEIDDGSLSGYAQPGMVVLASRAFSNPVNGKLLAQVVSHLWWPCLVSPATPDDAFLNEGLATYSAALYVQESAGDNAFEDIMHDISIGALTHEDAAPVSLAGHLHEFTPEYQSVVFQKGAMVFHMLRWVIGDEAFYKTLQAMTKDYAWKPVSTDEFQKLAEKASKQQLTYFFAQWVSSTGVPQFKRTWAVYKTPTGYQIVGKITQDLDIFRMPVEVRVYPEHRRPVSERVDMVGTTADFTINTITKPVRVVVDPASRLLKYDEQVKIAVEMARGDQLVQQQALLEAVKQYQDVLDLNKNYSLAHYRLAEVFFRLRNYNAAAEELRAALGGDLDPKWVEVWAHLTLGKIFDVTGQRDRALNEYQRALQTNDNTQGALDEANKYMSKPYAEPSR